MGAELWLVASAAVTTLALAVAAAALVALRRLEGRAGEVAEALAQERRLRAVEARLARALDLVDTESEAVVLAARALGEVLGDAPARLLLADPTLPRARWAIELEGGRPATPTPLDEVPACSALATGTTVVVDDTRRLEACPHLRTGAPASSACVPVSVQGEQVAALNATAEPGAPPPEPVVAAMEAVALRLGARIALLRTRQGSEGEATDPLTGAATRDAVEERIQQLVRDLVPFTVAVCDLDGTAELNRRFGEPAGDRALSLLASVLRTTLRPADVVGRVGPDEFLVVLPRCNPAHAGAALERVREQLLLALALGEDPGFTVSVGVAGSHQGDSVGEVVEAARAALRAARDDGGNQVRLAGELPRRG